MYDVYINKILLPINPEKITMKINGKNETVTMINDGEVSILKTPGLTDISFDLILPNTRYPFIHYADKKKTFHNSEWYLIRLDKMMKKKAVFQFIISRKIPIFSANSRQKGEKGVKVKSFNTNITCSLEKYSVIDDAKNGFDVKVQITLKQYRPYSTKTFKVKKPSPKAPVVVKPERPSPQFPFLFDGDISEYIARIKRQFH